MTNVLEKYNIVRYSRTEIVSSAVAYGRPDMTLSRSTSFRITVIVIFVSVKPEAREAVFDRTCSSVHTCKS